MSLKSSLKIVLLFLTLILLSCSQPNSIDNLTQQYHKLTKVYEARLQNNPQDIELRLELAEFYYNFKDYQKTIRLLENQTDQRARVLLAKSLAKNKDYDYAIEVFERVGVIDDSDYLYLYGRVLEEKNLFPKALEIYEKIEGGHKDKAKRRIEVIKIKVENKVPDIIAEISEEASEFLKGIKDDAAVYLLVDEESLIKEDNTSVFAVHVIKKVLEERGKELAEVQVGYDSTYERVELEFARTITKEGKVLYAGAENIRDIGLYRNFPLYSNSRAFVVSMPSVEVGSFIEYKLKIHSSKLVAEDNFNFIYRLQEPYPAFKSSFKIIVPEGKYVNFKVLNKKYSKGRNLNPVITHKEKQTIYSLSFREIKPIIPEYSMPDYSYINSAVLISSFSSWEQIYNWWHSLYKDKITLTPEMKKFVNNLIKDQKTNLDKAKKIYEHVAKNVRYVAIEYGDSGHEPHSAQEVFINGYGDCKDQAVLLCALLKYAGFKAYPVLIPTRGTYPVSKDFPSINFNHAIAALSIGEELIFMDATSETTPFRQIPLSDQDRDVLVFSQEGYKIVNTGHIKDNQIMYFMDIELNEDENAFITRRVSSFGFFASSYRRYLKYTHPAQIKDSIQEKMREISSMSKLIEYEIMNADNFDAPPVLTYKFSAEKFLNPARDLRIVPVLDQLNLDRALIGKEKREYPIDFDGHHSISARINISLPKGWRVKYLPRSKKVKNPWFSLDVSYEEFGGNVDFYQRFTVNKRFVESEEYFDFKKKFEDALYLLREEIILEKAAEENI